MNRFTPVLIAITLVFASTSACAQADRRTKARQAMQERLKAADANGDGYISRAEADAKLPRLAKNFDQLDSDKDGRLSLDEMRQAAELLRQRRGS